MNYWLSSPISSLSSHTVRWLAIWIPFFAAAASASWAGGAVFSKRILMGIACGALIELLYALLNILLGNILIRQGNEQLLSLQLIGQITAKALWRVFLFSLLGLAGAFVAETRPASPKKSVTSYSQ